MKIDEKISRSTVSSGPKKSKIFGSEKIENFRSRKFSFSYIFQWKFSIFSNSKNFRKNKFPDFFENFWDRKFSLKIVWKWKISRSKIFDFFGPKNFRLLRTRTDRAPRDLNIFCSSQNVVKIMVFYFPKICGFPMLRSTQDNEKSKVLWVGLLSLWIRHEMSPNSWNHTWNSLRVSSYESKSAVFFRFFWKVQYHKTDFSTEFCHFLISENLEYHLSNALLARLWLIPVQFLRSAEHVGHTSRYPTLN